MGNIPACYVSLPTCASIITKLSNRNATTNRVTTGLFKDWWNANIASKPCNWAPYDFTSKVVQHGPSYHPRVVKVVPAFCDSVWRPGFCSKWAVSCSNLSKKQAWQHMKKAGKDGNMQFFHIFSVFLYLFLGLLIEIRVG